VIYLIIFSGFIVST